ncbi:MAG: proton-conducting transporter membrane subunit, partial [Dethiobacteria bacterium]
GQVMIWIGIVTMFFGAVSAMLQDNIKRMLACSSISQMGYIIMGVGAAAYIGYNGAMGLAGSSFHILNHALFKSALFLVAGVIVYALGELDMRELGGLARKMPFSMAIALIASFGIVGIPFFNGYSSKTLLHHAIVKAQHLEQLPSLQVAEWIFILTSACTVCYFIKFLYYTFFRKSGRIYAGLKAEPPLMKVGMGILGIAMLAFGFFPNLVLDKFILPALNNFMFDPANIEQYLAGINFWVLEDIWSIVITLGLGIIIYGLAAKTNFFRIKVPQWLTQEYIGYYIGRGAVILWGFVTMVVNFILNIFAWFFGVIFRATFRLHQGLDYKPHSPIYRAVNFGNIDFDIFLVLTVLGAILFCLFYLQFGI